MNRYDACQNLNAEQRARLRELLVAQHADQMPQTAPRIRAYVASDTASPTQLKEQLARVLPGAAVPEDLQVFAELPRLPNGKLDRQALAHPQHEETVSEVRHPLAEIWSELLPGAKTTPDAHFFNQGGHSLMVLQLVERVEARCGVTLRPADLFQHPTFGEQLRLIEEHERSEKPEFNHLVTLRAGGSKPPLFLVKTGAMGPALVEGLDPEVPIYVLRGIAHRPEGNWRRWKNLRELAAEQLEEIRTVHPVGPYFLGGYSVGGLVAWELARLLEEQGETVLSLWLFDPSVPNIFRKGPLALQLNRGTMRPEDYSLTGALACWLSENHPFGQRLYRKTAHRFLLMPWRRTLVKKSMRLREQGGTLTPEMLEADFSLASYDYHRSWAPFPYAGRTLLVHSTRTPFNTRALISPWFTGSFQEAGFDAGHLDMARQPEHVERLLQVLNQDVATSLGEG